MDDAQAQVFNGRWPRLLLRLSQVVADNHMPSWLDQFRADGSSGDVPSSPEVSDLWQRHVEALPQLSDAAMYTMAAFINASFSPEVQLRVDVKTLERQWPSVWQAFFKALVRQAQNEKYWTLYGRDRTQNSRQTMLRALRCVLKFVVIAKNDKSILPTLVNEDDGVPSYREVEIDGRDIYAIGEPEPAPPTHDASPIHNVKYKKGHHSEEDDDDVQIGHADKVDWSKLVKA